MLASTVLVASGLGLLWTGLPVARASASWLYGAGVGIDRSRAGRCLGTVRRPGYAALMGRLAMPMLIAGALAPSAGALLLDRIGVTGTLATLAGMATVNVSLMVGLLMLIRGHHKKRRT